MNIRVIMTFNKEHQSKYFKNDDYISIGNRFISVKDAFKEIAICSNMKYNVKVSELAGGFFGA